MADKPDEFSYMLVNYEKICPDFIYRFVPESVCTGFSGAGQDDLH